MVELKHICFDCAEVTTRRVGTFIETTCVHFPAVMQQVRGNVTACDKFKAIVREKPVEGPDNPVKKVVKKKPAKKKAIK